MAIRVPINPQTNVPQGQLGYAKPVDVTAGTRALAAVVDKYAQQTAQDEKKRELFEVQRLLVDETNNIQTDFEDKIKVQPLGAPNFTQQVNGEYNTRHQQMVADLKARGYSDDAVQEFATRLGTIRSQYVARAIDFQDKSSFSKSRGDARQLAISLSQYTEKNPNAISSALDEYRVALTHSGLDAVEQQTVYEEDKGVILAGARQGFAFQHPEIVVGLYGLGHELTTTSPTNLPAGQEFNLPTYIQKLAPAEGTAKNPRSSAIGFGQFLNSTWLENYKEVFGNTGESKEQILAKRKDRTTAVRITEHLTNKNVQGLISAGAPVNEATVYLAHFLGLSDAVKVVGAHADATIRGLVTPASIKANPGVFKNVRTAADLIAWAQGKMGIEPPAAQSTVTWLQPVPGREYNVEDAIQELKMPPEVAEEFVRTGKVPTTASVVSGQIAPSNIDVSQLPAVRNSDGTVSTVRSISIEEEGKVYLIPTVINGQVVSNDDAITAFHQTGQHLGVFKDEKSAETYAQQLHQSEARRVSGIEFDAEGKTGIAVLDLASASERMQMLTLARTILNEREADANAAQKEAHNNWYNNFLNQLQDGKLGQVDLDNAYKNGQITDFDERRKAQAIINDRNKQNEDLVRFHAMLRSGQKFNPYDKSAQDAVDAGFDNAVRFAQKQGGDSYADPLSIGLRAWQKTGIVPKQLGIMLRGALISTDSRQVSAGAAIADNMIKENPNAFAGVEGQSEIEHAAVAYGHYIYDLGMSPQEASTRIAQENDPKVKEKFKYNEPATVEAIKTLRQAGVNAAEVFDNDAAFPNQDALNEGNQTYYSLIRDELNRGLSLTEARVQAAAQMKKVYGVNFQGRIVKYPPERSYPPIDGKWNYVYDDAARTVKEETGVDPISVNLVPIPGVTDEDFRRGRPARYRLIYVHKVGEQTVADSVPGQFAADISSAARAASIENRNRFAKERQRQVNLTKSRRGGIRYNEPGLSPAFPAR